MDKVERIKLGDDILRKLRKAILLGEFAPNDHLSEPALAEQFGTSRAPIRDALHVLIREGFASKLPNGRVVVQGMTPEDIANLYEVRCLLESFALTKWYEASEPSSLFPLRQCLDKMNLNTVTSSEFSKIDMEFHEQMIRLAGNRSVLHSWLSIKDTVHSMLEITNQSYPRGKHIVHVHSTIVDCLAQGKVENAINALKQHLHEGQQIMSETIQNLRRIR